MEFGKMQNMEYIQGGHALQSGYPTQGLVHLLEMLGFFFCLCQNTINKVIEPKENSIRIQTQIIPL